MRFKVYIFLLILYTGFQTTGFANHKGSKKHQMGEEKTTDTVRFEYASFNDGLKLLQDLNYTPEAWQAGIREIPHLLIIEIPQRWRQNTTQDIEVKLKKQVFFRIVAPLALSVNEDNLSDREKLEKIIRKGIPGLSGDELNWLTQLAQQYKVIENGNDIEESHLKELWVRVDIIPLSLVLAQSAEESGWGTSRFAAEGNALFGQWAWGENTIKPKEQRSGMGDYGLARFDSPLESMRAYMLNLNTHAAYANLRKVRADLRNKGNQVDGVSLARTLTSYSERGEEYVETLLSIMNYNHLNQADEAYLKKDPVILFIPIVE